MKVDIVQLWQFRNYTDAEVQFHPRVNLLLGQNGQGKSNLIEAVHLILTGTTFRQLNRNDLIRNGQPGSKIKAIINSRGLSKNCDISLTQKMKQILLNNQPTSVNKLRQNFAAVEFTPDSLSVIKQGPSERRKFIDSIFTTIEGDATALINQYVRCVKTRNKLYSSVQDGTLKQNEAINLFESLEPRFLNLACRLTMARIETLKTMNLKAKPLSKAILKRSDVDISVDYVISNHSAIAWSQNQVYDALKSRMSELRQAEWATCQTLVGPHRHDVQINLNEQNLRHFGSQGQQRAIVLAFKLAQVHYYFEKHREYPVLLLDDVFSELDAEKREKLFEELSKIPAQIFITATEIDEKIKFNPEDRKVFDVCEGKVSSGWK